jgi:hypothetical protein
LLRQLPHLEGGANRPLSTAMIAWSGAKPMRRTLTMYRPGSSCRRTKDPAESAATCRVRVLAG